MDIEKEKHLKDWLSSFTMEQEQMRQVSGYHCEDCKAKNSMDPVLEIKMSSSV